MNLECKSPSPPAPLPEAGRGELDLSCAPSVVCVEVGRGEFGRGVARCGFTLVETVVVVCILGLLASGSLLLLSGPLRKASREGTMLDVVEQHQWARRHARNKPANIVFDLAGQQSEAVAGREVSSVIGYGGDSRLEKIIVGGAVLEGGRATVHYANGGCQSYAVLLGRANGNGNWLFVCGPTGQVEVVEDKNETATDLAKWLAKWAHVD